MNPNLDREKLKTLALGIAGIIAMWCMFIIGWCTMWKIYIEIPVLFVLSNMATGITSCITTILVGRTLAQLNQGADSDTTMTQTTQTTTTPKVVPPAVQTDDTLIITKQPEVALKKDSVKDSPVEEPHVDNLVK